MNEPGNPPHSEAPLPSNGVRLVIEDPDAIYAGIERGDSGSMGTLLLPYPLNQIEVEASSQNGTFDLATAISFDFSAKHGMGPGGLAERVNLDELVSTIVRRYIQYNPEHKPIERGGHYIITTDSGNRFVLSSNIHGPVDDIIITTGSYEDGIGREVKLLPSVEKSRDHFEQVLPDYLELVREVVEECYRQSRERPPDETLVLKPPVKEIALNGLKKTVSKEELLGKLQIEKPDVDFEDIGGQPAAKKEIEGLSFALKNPELYKKWGTRPPKGIMLYGPPGTGKTLLAKALAAQADARFFHVEASDIASKWYGESESIVKAIFELANSSPEKTLLFIDEIDAIAPHREDAHEATQRVLGTILENMDGMSASSNVMVVASTNRLRSIDSALTRAGRFDRWVEVGLPDEEGRQQIFGIHMRKAEELAERPLFSGVNIEALVPKTEGFNGADIAEIIRRVLEEKVRQEGKGQEPEPVSTEDIVAIMKDYEKVQAEKKEVEASYITPPNVRLH